MKKWYLSKTILVAMAMEALAQVTMHMEEVKTAIASHTNTDAGLAFAIAFPAVMVAMRFVTTKPIEGVKNVSKSEQSGDREDQTMGDDCSRGLCDGYGCNDCNPTVSDQSAGERESNAGTNGKNQRVAGGDAKPRGRSKRRRSRKG